MKIGEVWICIKDDNTGAYRRIVGDKVIIVDLKYDESYYKMYNMMDKKDHQIVVVADLNGEREGWLADFEFVQYYTKDWS